MHDSRFSSTVPEQVRRLWAHESGVRALACSPDGRLLAAADTDRRFSVWRDGQILWSTDFVPWWQRRPSSRMVHSIAFSLDSKLLFAGLSEHIVAIDAELGSIVWRSRTRSIMVFLPNAAVCLAVNPESGTLAAALADGHLGIWSTDGQRRAYWFDDNAPRHFDFTRDGSRIVGTDGFSLSIWDASSHAKIARRRGLDKFFSLAVSPLDDIVATRKLREVTIWKLETGHEMAKVAVGPGLPVIAFSPVQERLAFTERSRVRIVDFRGDERAEIPIEDALPLSICYSPDGSELFVGCSDGSIRGFLGSP